MMGDALAPRVKDSGDRRSAKIGGLYSAVGVFDVARRLLGNMIREYN
jgi:hypothetical protein